MKVLQQDSSYVYTFGLEGIPEAGKFKNVVLAEVQGGYIGALIEYEPDSDAAAGESFSGTIERYDLEGTLLNEMKISNAGRK